MVCDKPTAKRSQRLIVYPAFTSSTVHACTHAIQGLLLTSFLGMLKNIETGGKCGAVESFVSHHLCSYKAALMHRRLFPN